MGTTTGPYKGVPGWGRAGEQCKGTELAGLLPRLWYTHQAGPPHPLASGCPDTQGGQDWLWE